MPDEIMKPVSLKHASLFTGLTLGITWIVEAVMIVNGFSAERLLEPGAMLLLVAVMWVPGVCALMVNMLAGRPLSALGLRFGSWKPYAATVFLVPLIFMASYGLTWLLGISEPDWTMKTLLQSMRMSPGAEAPAYHALLIMLPASALLGPIFNFLAALGEELGWRGLLLPSLMQLGKLRAYLLLGLIWGIWHLPLILVGFNYPGHPFIGALLMCFGTIAIGTFINEFALAYRSTLLAAFIHAAINAQAYGVWKYIFPDNNPVLGGDTGLTGIICWLVASLLVFFWFRKLGNPRSPQS
jgi:hypothetical protein